MTLVISLKTKDGIVMASDSKASSEITSNDTVQKIFKLSENSAVGIAGDGSLAVYFLDQVKSGLNYGTGILDLAEQIRVKGKEKFNDFFEHLVPEKRPLLTLLLAGYTTDKVAEIYTLRSTDNFVPRKAVTGFKCIGIPYIAEYLLNGLYEDEIKLESGVAMSALCIQETGAQNESVGGPTRVYTFSSSESFKEVSPSDVKKLKEKNNQFQVKQKSRFYPEDQDAGTDNPVS